MAEDLPLKPTAVLIEWTGDNLKYIADKVFLNTGINEVPAADWERLRWMVEDLIADPAKLRDSERKEGRIIERFAAVEAPKGKDTKSIVKTAKTLNDLDDLEAIAVIEETNSIATLNKWKKASGKDSIRVAINDQIEKINKAESK